jgi:hypothetical protein
MIKPSEYERWAANHYRAALEEIIKSNWYISPHAAKLIVIGDEHLQRFVENLLKEI